MTDAALPTGLHWLNLSDLKPHESVKERKAEHYARVAGRSRNMIAKPILVDSKTHVILDGHHRWWVCTQLGLEKVPCYLVDYLHDDTISVLPRRADIPVTKESVIAMGLSGNVYPHKTTKHVFHIPMMEKMVNFKQGQTKRPDLA